jgi:glycosyltransferase involved in cell wall biosynthesis
MRTSIVIAARNEGQNLQNTVQCCLEELRDLEGEIVIADDASTDSSQGMIPNSSVIRLVSHLTQRGVARTKHLAAAHAIGRTLIFLDAHCKPMPGSLRLLVEDIERLDGEAVVAPRITALDSDRWEIVENLSGNGYALDLLSFEERWIRLAELRRRGTFFESPNLAGCCFALTRELYERLGKLDQGMRDWGSEHVEFGLRTWLFGSRVLIDIDAVVGHRFRFDEGGPARSILANKMRLARLHFTEPNWQHWCDTTNSSPRDGALWNAAWKMFLETREDTERTRECLFNRRVHDEYWYADEFTMNWPRRNQVIQNARHSHGPDPKGSFDIRIAPRPWGGHDIQSAQFHGPGGPVASYGALITEMTEGRTIEWALRLQPSDLLRRRAVGKSPADTASCVLQSFQNSLHELPEAAEIPRSHATHRSVRITHPAPLNR